MSEPVAPGAARPQLTPAELANLISAFNDVTARLNTSHEALRADVARLTRELGEANAQLERSRRLAGLGEMAAGIAHEVRNPLGSIRLYARMLEEDLAGVPAQAEIATRIIAATRAVEGIVGDVLSFAREIRLRLQPVELGPLMERALEACLEEGVPGWSQTRVQRPEGAGVVAEADAALLHQVLINVIRNAMEAMGEQPAETRGLKLGVRKRRVSDASGKQSPHAAMLIEDTGPGVDPAVIPRMFNPFFTTRPAGTGLGLAIVHRIVDAHGGRVSVNNVTAPGRGARFEILLPLSAAPQRGPADTTVLSESHA